MNRRRPTITSLIAFAFAVLAASFLSFGPVFALVLAGQIPDDLPGPLGTAYAPVPWSIENVVWIAEFYQCFVWWLLELVDACIQINTAGHLNAVFADPT